MSDPRERWLAFRLIASGIIFLLVMWFFLTS
jgi:hypothetical protein